MNTASLKKHSDRGKPGSHGYFFLIAFLVVLADQISKFLVRSYLALGEKFNLVDSFLEISRIHNTGAGWSILQGQRWLLVWISIMVIGAILYYYQEFSKNKAQFVAISLILGGAIGNLIDRLFLGYVVDFISFSFWPAFNVADSCLSIGAAILVITMIIDCWKNKN